VKPVAWVAGDPLDVSDVDERERAIRSGPASAALPDVDSSEGRQLRRWLVQLIAAERLIARAAGERRVTVEHAPPLDELAADRPALLELGSVAASLLAGSALARAVFAAVTAHVRVNHDRIKRYHADNPEQFLVPEQRIVRHAIMASPDGDPRLYERPFRTLKLGELTGPVEEAVFQAAPGDTIGPIRNALGWHVLKVETVEPGHLRPLELVRPAIERRLLGTARRRAFTAWLDGRTADLVRLAPGYEHPGDPSQPDNTHRH
jgi:[acyl-carrier-protein] S-malonyltransferase